MIPHRTSRPFQRMRSREFLHPFTLLWRLGHATSAFVERLKYLLRAVSPSDKTDAAINTARPTPCRQWMATFFLPAVAPPTPQPALPPPWRSGNLPIFDGEGEEFQALRRHRSPSPIRSSSSTSSGVSSETTTWTPALRHAETSSSSQSPPRGRHDGEPPGPGSFDPMEIRRCAGHQTSNALYGPFHDHDLFLLESLFQLLLEFGGKSTCEARLRRGHGR